MDDVAYVGRMKSAWLPTSFPSHVPDNLLASLRKTTAEAMHELHKLCVAQYASMPCPPGLDMSHTASDRQLGPLTPHWMYSVLAVSARNVLSDCFSRRSA